MGLVNGKVYLEKNYNLWKNMYEEEVKKLNRIFKSNSFIINHVGSTSIKGLLSKPIIDILVGINSFDEINEYEKVLKELYIIKKSSDEILLIKEKDDETFFLIHIMLLNSKRYKDVIKFKNILINNPNILKEYEELKIRLSKLYSNDRKMYTKAKSEYIEKILKNML